jgi:hypothetical protein
LARQAYRHNKQDLIVLHLHNEEEFERVLEQAGMPAIPLEMKEEGTSLAVGDVRTLQLHSD